VNLTNLLLYQVAISDVVETCKNADILVFVLPHQFMYGICRQLQGHVKPTALGVSLIKVSVLECPAFTIYCLLI
jgi:glycerol-3-phosphate dehydrogenase